MIQQAMMWAIAASAWAAAPADFHTKAVAMDGSTEYMANTTDQSIWYTDGKSFSIWVNPTAAAGQRYLIDVANWTNNVNRSFLYINATDDTVRFVTYGSDGSTVSRRRTSNAVTEWSINHIVWTYSSNSLDIYLDWVAQSTWNENVVVSTSSTDTNRSIILWSVASGIWGSLFDWAFCRCDIFSTKLDATNVTALYASWVWYKLDLRNDTWGYDQSANLVHQHALWKNVSPDIWEDFVSSWWINVETNAAWIDDTNINTFA